MNEETRKRLANPAPRRDNRFTDQQNAENTAKKKQQPSLPALLIHDTPKRQTADLKEISIYQAGSIGVKETR